MFVNLMNLGAAFALANSEHTFDRWAFWTNVGCFTAALLVALVEAL